MGLIENMKLEFFMNEVGQSISPFKMLPANSGLAALQNAAGRAARVAQVVRHPKVKSLPHLMAEMHATNRKEAHLWFLLASSALAVVALSLAL